MKSEEDGRITKAKMRKAMNAQLKRSFQPVRYDDVIIVEEGYAFTEEVDFCSDTDSSSDDERQGDGILDLLKENLTKKTTFAVSRERVISDPQSDKPTMIVIGIGKPKKYPLDTKKSASMLNEIVNLLDENYQINVEALKLFVKEYGYLHNTIYNSRDDSFYPTIGINISKKFIIKGYDSLNTWQEFIINIVKIIIFWKHPLWDLYNPYTGENYYSREFRDIMIQYNEFYVNNNHIPIDSSKTIDNRRMSNKILLAQMLQDGLRDAQFLDTFYVRPDSGQLSLNRVPSDLYSYMWLWIEQAILYEDDPHSIHKCIYCNEYDMAINLNREQEINPITLERLYHHDVCYRRHMKRKTIEEKAKSEGRTLHIRPKARKNGV